MAISIYQKRFMERRKENGLCLKCGKPLDRDSAYCADCRKIINNNVFDERHWYQSHGICPRCRKNDLFGDEKNCPECTAAEYEVTMRSRQRLGRDHYNKNHKKWARDEHQKRIEQGICTRCGKRKADLGYKTCGICREKTNRKKRMRLEEKADKSERSEQGLCYFCNEPVKEGYKVCEKHYQMNIQKLGHDKCKKATEDLKKDMNKYFI